MPRPDLRSILRWSSPAVLLLALLVIRALGDRWWGALPLLYGPRWLLAALVPLPLLTWQAGSRSRGAITAAVVGALLTGMLLDVRVPWRMVLEQGRASADATVRVISWNAAGGGRNPETRALALTALDPQLIVIAECGAPLADALRNLPDYQLRETARVCIATTLPIIEWAPRDPRDFWKVGGGGSIGRMVVSANGRELVIGGVHLETPREALEDLQALAVRTFIRSDAEKRALRDRESRAAREWIAGDQETRPVIVGGDFNLPVESAIYRRWWGGLTNAFSVGGWGTGWTKMTSRFGVRIDHILVGNGVRVLGAEVGNAMGSDHRPVIATLVLPDA